MKILNTYKEEVVLKNSKFLDKKKHWHSYVMEETIYSKHKKQDTIMGTLENWILMK